MNMSTYGESLFEQYLISQSVAFEREPKLPGVGQLIDFVVDHPTGGKILLEVKDIEGALPPSGISAFDAYKPIREHIEEGTRKFKSTSDYVCALVLVVAPGGFVNLNEPHVILGAMYGDFGFKIPFDTEKGEANAEQISSEFLVGEGKMIRTTRLQNTRISALITLHNWQVWYFAMRKYLNSDDGRDRRERLADLYAGLVDLPEYDASQLGVTVWENAVATRRLPVDMFRGEMDAWWQCSDNGQSLRGCPARS